MSMSDRDAVIRARLDENGDVWVRVDNEVAAVRTGDDGGEFGEPCGEPFITTLEEMSALGWFGTQDEF